MAQAQENSAVLSIPPTNIKAGANRLIGTQIIISSVSGIAAGLLFPPHDVNQDERVDRGYKGSRSKFYMINAK